MFGLAWNTLRQVCETVSNMLYIYGSKGNVYRYVRYKNIPVGVGYLCHSRYLKVEL